MLLQEGLAQKMEERFRAEGKEKSHAYSITKTHEMFEATSAYIKAHGNFEFESDDFKYSVTKSGFMIRIAMEEKEPTLDELLMKKYEEDRIEGVVGYLVSEGSLEYKQMKYLLDVKAPQRIGNRLQAIFSKTDKGAMVYIGPSFKDVPAEAIKGTDLITSMIGYDSTLQGFVSKIFSKEEIKDPSTLLLGLKVMFDSHYTADVRYDKFLEIMEQNVIKHSADKSVTLDDFKELLGISKVPTMDEWIRGLTDSDMTSLQPKYPILKYVKKDAVPENAWRTIYREEVEKIS